MSITFTNYKCHYIVILKIFMVWLILGKTDCRWNSNAVMFIYHQLLRCHAVHATAHLAVSVRRYFRPKNWLLSPMGAVCTPTSNSRWSGYFVFFPAYSLGVYVPVSCQMIFWVDIHAFMLGILQLVLASHISHTLICCLLSEVAFCIHGHQGKDNRCK